PAFDCKAFSQEGLRPGFFSLPAKERKRAYFFPAGWFACSFFFFQKPCSALFFRFASINCCILSRLFLSLTSLPPHLFMFFLILYHKQKNFEKMIDSRREGMLILYQSILR